MDCSRFRCRTNYVARSGPTLTRDDEVITGSGSDRVSFVQLGWAVVLPGRSRSGTDCTPSVRPTSSGTLFTARQLLDQVIQTQPQTPAMMIKHQRKRDADNEQNRQHRLLV